MLEYTVRMLSDKDPIKMTKESKKRNDASSGAGPERPTEPLGKGERRSRHRVKNEQGSGQGALSALSKMKMIERKKSEVQPTPEHPSTNR